jgi:hypothetical protein
VPYGAPCPIPGAVNSVLCNENSCTVLQPSSCALPTACGWRGLF